MGTIKGKDMEKQIEVQNEIEVDNSADKLYKKVAFIQNTDNTGNPWTTQESVDKFGILSNFSFGTQEHRQFRDLVKMCRFFYRRDAMASSVINKLIEIAINGLRITKGSLNDNQFRVFEYVKEDIEDFIEQCAMEYLLSGLLIPEIEFSPVTKIQLSEAGIKKYTSLNLPTSMWIRDPSTIIIKASPLGSGESVYIEINNEMISFIQNGGTYVTGEIDTELYDQLVKFYPEFVRAVKEGKTLFKLDSPYMIKRRALVDSPYPTPYLSAALESLKHKRNIRRMDYSLASRAIGAIQQFKLGSDEFPLVEGDEAAVDEIKAQMHYRDSAGTYVERIFQLFTNHTVEIDWIIPDLTVLVDTEKYEEINLDILQALGFPKIMITGEVQRTGTTDANVAVLSPLKTMEYIRKKLIRIVRNIFNTIASSNGFLEIPKVDFNPINFVGFKDYIAGLNKLYESGNMSRTEYADVFGINFEDSMRTLTLDNNLIEELGLTEFAPLPNSREPLNVEKGNKSEEKSENKN